MFLLYFLSVWHTGVFCLSNNNVVQNVARGKETMQSTLSMYNSSLVVDGNYDQNLINGFCIHIEKKGESWWQVDLGDIYSIFNVKVYLSDIVVDGKDCYETPSTYRGKANTTEDGLPCQSWSISHPKIVNRSYVGPAHHENYCRGLTLMPITCYLNIISGVGFMLIPICTNGIAKPWCFTTDPDILWQYCAVEKCETGGTRDLILQTGIKGGEMEIPDIIETFNMSLNVREFVLHNNPRSRYVRLLQDGTRDYYPLCEVEVYGIKDDTINVALNKPTEISSYIGQFGPGYAVDGGLKINSHFETDVEVNPWWRVDLFGIYVVFMVRLFNRLDCCSHTSHDILMQFGTSLDILTNVSFVEGQIRDIQNIILPTNIQARFVQIVRTGIVAETFNLYEVEVLGKIAECNPNPCDNGGHCSVIHCEDSQCRNYFCTCADGYGSVNCGLRTFNVAIGKQIEMSSVKYKKWHPNNALDGDNNQDVLYGATCVSTQKEIKPYFTVDFNDVYNITDVKVFLRSDCCPDSSKEVELFAFMTTWTNVGVTDSLIRNQIAYLIYPYVVTRSIRVMAKEGGPVYLQICEIEVYAISNEENYSNITLTSPSPTSPTMSTNQPVISYIQMRFALSDKYNEVVLSESSFLNSVRQGLSLQTGYSVNSFTNMQIEREPFRVSLQLHSDGGNVTVLEMFERIDTLIRFGIRDIENENGQMLAITAGSLQHYIGANVQQRCRGRTKFPELKSRIEVGLDCYLPRARNFCCLAKFQICESIKLASTVIQMMMMFILGIAIL